MIEDTRKWEEPVSTLVHNLGSRLVLRILRVCTTLAEGPCLAPSTHVGWLKDAYNSVSSSGHHRHVNIPVDRSTAYKMLNDFAKTLFYSVWQLSHSWKVCFLKMKIPYQPQFSPYNFCLPTHFLRSPMPWKKSKTNKTFSSYYMKLCCW